MSHCVGPGRSRLFEILSLVHLVRSSSYAGQPLPADCTCGGGWLRPAANKIRLPLRRRRHLRGNNSKWPCCSNSKDQAAPARWTWTIKICKPSWPNAAAKSFTARSTVRHTQQLNSTTQQLTQSRETQQNTEQQSQNMAASMGKRSAASITANNSLERNLPTINIPGVEVRQDGDVVRVEMPVDRLFVPDANPTRRGADTGQRG